MFKKMLSIAMLFVFMTVQANAGTNNSLKAIFDDLNYSLTVEWDQKDKGFHDAQVEKFNKRIADARANGASVEEIAQYAVSQVKDAKIAKELQTTLSLLKIGALSQAEAQKMLMETVKRSQISGASWNGSAGPVLIAIAIIAGMVLLFYALSCKGEVVGTGEYHEVCTDVCERDYPDRCYRDCNMEEITICVEDGVVQ